MPSINAGLLVAGGIVAFIGAFSVFVTTLTTEVPAQMQISPQIETATVGEMITVDVVVESTVPVNVFGGELQFDSSVLKVSSIDYNTSIADLWAELPWFENGEGTLNFGGGTTQPGGFTGTGELITVTFETLSIGNGNLTINKPRILRHDGAGTDVDLKEVIEAVVQVAEEEPKENLITAEIVENSVTITPKEASTDLNGDDKQTIADVSIFMLNMAGNDSRYDFNGDGRVNTKDLAILLSL